MAIGLWKVLGAFELDQTAQLVVIQCIYGFPGGRTDVALARGLLGFLYALLNARQVSGQLGLAFFACLAFLVCTLIASIIARELGQLLLELGQQLYLLGAQGFDFALHLCDVHTFGGESGRWQGRAAQSYLQGVFSATCQLHLGQGLRLARCIFALGVDQHHLQRGVLKHTVEGLGGGKAQQQQTGVGQH